jgi:hypothetical protein
MNETQVLVHFDGGDSKTYLLVRVDNPDAKTSFVRVTRHWPAEVFTRATLNSEHVCLLASRQAGQWRCSYVSFARTVFVACDDNSDYRNAPVQNATHAVGE